MSEGNCRFERESNVELLRILAMFAIIAEHFVSQGRVDISNGGLASILVSSAGRIAVNVFLIIGCWFMVGSRFRSERMMKLYAEVCFYSIPITLVMFALGEAGGTRNVIQGCVPFFGRSVWFASAYISLIALTPFLNKILEWPRPMLNRLMALLFVFFCIVSTIPQFTPFEYLADFCWFIVVYLFVGWSKQGELWNRMGGPVFSFLFAVTVYACLCVMKLTPAGPIAAYWMGNIRSLPSLVVAVMIFNAFRRIDVGRHRSVNIMARSSFAVYIVHQIPAFEHFEWSLFAPARISEMSMVFQPLAIVAVSIAVFVGVTLIDAIRIGFIESRYLSLSPVKYIQVKIGEWFGFVSTHATRSAKMIKYTT